MTFYNFNLPSPILDSVNNLRRSISEVLQNPEILISLLSCKPITSSQNIFELNRVYFQLNGYIF